jgi:hypothetical protein
MYDVESMMWNNLNNDVTNEVNLRVLCSLFKKIF